MNCVILALAVVAVTAEQPATIPVPENLEAVNLEMAKQHTEMGTFCSETHCKIVHKDFVAHVARFNAEFPHIHTLQLTKARSFRVVARHNGMTAEAHDPVSNTPITEEDWNGVSEFKNVEALEEREQRSVEILGKWLVKFEKQNAMIAEAKKEQLEIGDDEENDEVDDILDDEDLVELETNLDGLSQNTQNGGWSWRRRRRRRRENPATSSNWAVKMEVWRKPCGGIGSHTATVQYKQKTGATESPYFFCPNYGSLPDDYDGDTGTEDYDDYYNMDHKCSAYGPAGAKSTRTLSTCCGAASDANGMELSWIVSNCNKASKRQIKNVKANKDDQYCSSCTGLLCSFNWWTPDCDYT